MRAALTHLRRSLPAARARPSRGGAEPTLAAPRHLHHVPLLDQWVAAACLRPAGAVAAPGAIPAWRRQSGAASGPRRAQHGTARHRTAPHRTARGRWGGGARHNGVQCSAGRSSGGGRDWRGAGRARGARGRRCMRRRLRPRGDHCRHVPGQLQQPEPGPAYLRIPAHQLVSTGWGGVGPSPVGCDGPGRGHAGRWG